MLTCLVYGIYSIDAESPLRVLWICNSRKGRNIRGTAHKYLGVRGSMRRLRNYAVRKRSRNTLVCKAYAKAIGEVTARRTVRADMKVVGRGLRE